jgi:hypothetical protein
MVRPPAVQASAMSRGGDRPVQAARFAGLADDDDGQAADAFGDAFGFLAALDVLRFELRALLLEAARLSLLARSAFFCGSRKLRA